MGEVHPYNDIVCVQKASFFLPFFDFGDGCKQCITPWDVYKEGDISSEGLKRIADFTKERIDKCAEVITFLYTLHPDWDITPHHDGIYIGTDVLSFEEILPKLDEAGFTGSDFVIYTEYTQKWGR